MADKPINQLMPLNKVTDETLIPAWDPSAPDTGLALTGKQLKYITSFSDILAVKNYHLADSTTQQASLSRMSAVVSELVKSDGAEGIRLNSVGVKTTGSGTVKFGVYSLNNRGDGTGTLTCVAVLGEAQSVGGYAGLENLNYYSEEQTLFVMAFAKTPIIGCWELAGLTMMDAPHFDDADFYGKDVGGVISCRLDLWEEPFMACFKLDYDSVTKTTISDFAAETNQRLDALEQGGGSGEGKLPPTKVDLTAFESSGVIVETYADGSRITYNMEFDADGNPTKVTDSNGNVTTLTW